MCEPQLKKIPFNQLGKAAYNRPINRRRVNDIKRKFNQDMVMPAIVSFRDGRYWIIDHQHQTQAIYELNGNNPNILILCDVRYGLTYEQEADLYFRLNTGQTKLTSLDKLIGLIEAKDNDAMRFRGIVESHGYVIGGCSSNSLRAVDKSLKIFRKNNGEQILSEIFSITRECWPDNKAAVHTYIILGLELFIKFHGTEYKREQLIKTLKSKDPNEIKGQGEATFDIMRRYRAYTKEHCTYMAIVDVYNERLKRNKIVKVLPE